MDNCQHSPENDAIVKSFLFAFCFFLFGNINAQIEESPNVIEIEQLKEIADFNAKALWGSTFSEEPVPYYGYDGSVMGYMFIYGIGKPFPSRIEIADRSKTVSNKKLKWGIGEYGKILLGNNPDYSLVLEYSNSLPPELAMINEIEHVAKERLGQGAQFDRVFYFNHYRQWARYTNGEEHLYINVLPPKSILTEEEFQELAQRQKNYKATIVDKFRSKKNTYRSGQLINLAATEKLIPNWEMIPVLDWSYGCSPTSAAMVLGYWDYNSINSSKNYSNLILFRLTRYDQLETEWDYQVPDLQYILAIQMKTDTTTGSTSTSNFEAGIEAASNTIRGYNFSVDHDTEFPWSSLKNRVDEGRPSLWTTDDTNGTGEGHTWCAFGYNDGTDMLATYDTWNSAIHWIDKDGHGDADITEIYEGGHTGYSINMYHPLGDTIYNHNGSGEVYNAGDVCEVTWVTDIHDGSRDVDIWLSTTGKGGDHTFSIVNNTENDGVYDWLIPATISSSTSRIGVWLKDGGGVEGGDGSIGQFTINPGGNVPYLVSDIAQTNVTNPDYFLVDHDQPSWAVVGSRVRFSGYFMDMEGFQDHTFTDKDYEGNGSSNIDFYVIDGHHAPVQDRGIKSKYFTALDPFEAETEFEGDVQALTVGMNGSLTWAETDVVRAYDVHLTPGNYFFKLVMEEGDWRPDLNIGLFGSHDGTFIKGRNQWINASYNVGYGTAEEFEVTITLEDDYAFIIWCPFRGSADYSIDVRRLKTGTWRGDISNDWHDPDNWDYGVIPTSTVDVVVGDMPHDPGIYNDDAMCRNIEVENHALLSISDKVLIVEEDMLITGELVLFEGFNGETQLIVEGDLEWMGQAHGQMDPGTELIVYGDWTYGASTSVFLNDGTVEFRGSSTTHIYNHSPDSHFPNVVNNKTNLNTCSLEMTTHPMVIKGSYTGMSGAIFGNNTLNQLILEGQEMNVMPGSIFWFSNGRVDFRGSSTWVSMNPESSFHDVNIQPSDTVYLFTDIKIGGDLYIEGGVLDVRHHDIEIKGDWKNMAGYQAFNQGLGRVIFAGTAIQFCENESFYDLELNKTGGDVRILTGSTYCQHYYWTQGELSVRGGNFTSYDMVGQGIYGTLRITAGTMIINQDAGDYIDLSGDLIMTGGNLYVNGGRGDSFWPFNNDASITMSGGFIEFRDVGIVITGSIGLGLTENITGGTIRTSGQLRITRTDFTPSGGTLELYGSGAEDLYVDGNSHLYNLTINKDAGVSVSGTNDWNCLNDFNLQSGIYIAEGDMSVGGDWYNYSGSTHFMEDTFSVTFYDYDQSQIHHDETFYRLVIHKPDLLYDEVTLAKNITLTVLDDVRLENGALIFSDDNLLNIAGTMWIGSGALLDASAAANVMIEVGKDWVNVNSTCTPDRGFLVGTSTVNMNGWENQNIYNNCPEPTFYNLVVENHDYHVNSWNPTHIANNFTFIKGDFHAPDSMWVKGDWVNMNIPGTFDHNDGVVIFEGSGSSLIPYSTSLYNVVLNKTYSGIGGLELNGGITFGVEGDLKIKDGTLEMNDNSVLDIEGGLKIYGNAGLNAIDDSNLNIYVGGHWVDDNTMASPTIGFSAGTSRVTLDGSTNYQEVICLGTYAEFYELIIDKPSHVGLEDCVMPYTNMRFLEDLVVENGRWFNQYNKHYTYELYKDLTIYSGAVWEDEASTIIFKGSIDQKWTPSPTLADSRFHNITIDKPSGSVVLYDNAQSFNGGYLSVQRGILDLNGFDFHVGGDAEILINGSVVNSGGGELRIGVDPSI